MRRFLLALFLFAGSVNAQVDKGMKAYLGKLCAVKQPVAQKCILKETYPGAADEPVQISRYRNREISIELRRNIDRPGHNTLSINGKQFSLEQTKLLNRTETNSLNLNAFDLDQDGVTFYRWGTRKYYLLEGGIARCNGSGCGVAFYLVYDVQHKTISAFYTFRVYTRLMLVNVNDDRDIDFIVVNNDGFNEPSPFEILFYSFNGKGKVYLNKDAKGRPYAISGSDSPFLVESGTVTSQRWPGK